MRSTCFGPILSIIRQPCNLDIMLSTDRQKISRAGYNILHSISTGCSLGFAMDVFTPGRHPPNQNSILILITTVLVLNTYYVIFDFSALQSLEPIIIKPTEFYFFGLFEIINRTQDHFCNMCWRMIWTELLPLSRAVGCARYVLPSRSAAGSHPS